jgi:hypothetical protein
VTEHPESFSAPILTSNFDPLIEVSIRKAGGHPTAIFLAADGQFANVISPSSTKVVHLHGFWRGSDTLHTPAQLMRHRPQLKGCLRSLLRETTLVVMAYGGWSDVFTQTLIEVIGEQTESLNVLWTFYSDSDDDILSRNEPLLQKLEPLAGQRVVFYKGVDCHVFLPRLREKLHKPEGVSIQRALETSSTVLPITTGGGSDHPPQPLSWVGREYELRVLLSSPARVISISGLGGNGKSTLAAKYLELKKGAEEIAFWCWADCKEDGNTLRTQLIRMVDRISRGSVKGEQLRDSSTDDVIEILFELIGRIRAVIVFDNIDQYIEVEECKAHGIMATLVDRALRADHLAQFVFTGRPRLDYAERDFLQLQLQGLTVAETRRLFEVSGVVIDPSTASQKITEAHRLTSGHPLVLNLIATQVAKNKANLDVLLLDLKNGIDAGIENPILLNIWDTLNVKQQTVLRYLAELVHSETEQRVANYLGNALNFNQFGKAVRALKALNLIVVKSPGDNHPDTLELHPLIRDFIRRRFQRAERTPYIDSIIHFCDRMITKFRCVVFSVSTDVLENWTAKVELCLECGRYSDALESLHEVTGALFSHGFSEEFIRLATPVLESYQTTPDQSELKRHDGVSKELISGLTQLGRSEDVEIAIDRFAKTVSGKTARYILLCYVRAYAYWLLFDFDKSKKWASEGVRFKSETNLDTQFDCSHVLALARRDSGDVEPALKQFLETSTLDMVLADTEDFADRKGHFFGNIGRSLYLLGKYREAVFFVRK